MKKIYAYSRYTLLYALLIAAVFSLLLYANGRQNYIRSGDMLPRDLDTKLYTVLSDTVLTQGERVHYRFEGGEAQSFSILLMSAGPSLDYSVYHGDSLRYRSYGRDYNHIITIDHTFYDGAPGSFSFDVELGSIRNPETVCLILASSARLEEAKLLYTATHVFILGILFLMFVQALFLYYKKPDESYLRWFAAYCIVLVVWGVSKINMGFNYHFSLAMDRYNGYMVLLNISIGSAACYSFQGIEFKGRLKPLTKWYVIFFISFFLYELRDALPLPAPLHSGFNLHLLLYAFTLGGLIYGSVKGLQGSRRIAVGYSIAWAFRLLVSMMFQRQTPTSYFSLILRVSRLVDLPLAASFFFHINATFAEKFKDTERLSAQLAEANANLDQKVAARTKELEEQQRQRHSMMMNTFHDLRSPLFIVKGCTDIIPVESEKAREKLNIMRERLDFAIHLTEELFLAAKLEEQQLLFAEEIYDLSEVVRAQVDSARILAAGKGIRVESALCDSCILFGDAYRITQAIQNLVNNAVQFTPEDGLVKVDMFQTDSFAEITVRDTGRGMEAADAEKVFTRFYRVEESSHSASTGLGLSIAKEIIEQHGGEIRVESKKGLGTCFFICLPKD